jgi:OFA family oxalate/formate antiporter-like MFS transporter
LNRWVVAAAAVVMQVGLGSYYAWSVFREPLSSLYGAGITGVNTAFFLASLTFSFAALGAGFWMRRVSPRVVGVAGGSLYGMGVFLSSFAESLPVLYLTYGLVAGVGLGFGYIAPVVTLPRWFPDRPGLAYGIAVCGFGAGSAINVPIITTLMPLTGGPLPTFGVLGVAYAVLVGGGASFMKDPPEDRKLGGLEPPRRENGKAAPAAAAPAAAAWDLRGALKTWQWYALWAMFFMNTTAGLAILSDAKAMAASIGGGTATLASAFVVIVAAADTTGRLFWPTLSDKIGQNSVFVVMFLLQAVMFLLLPLLGAGSFVMFSALSFVVLTCYGGGYGTMPAFADAYYGSRDVGTIYASLITATGVAGFGAPFLLAQSVDATGSYGPALYVTAALMLLSAAIPLVIRPPKPPR